MSHTYHSTDFTYNKAKNCFVAEASDLFDFNGSSFYIHSAKTGQVRLFLINRREFTEDADHEFVAWHGFCPAGGYRCTIFND